ncbi:subtilisin-like protease SBT5.3 [Papaver somniferum]|uniref:subtilisin-like protease SBT5.3 n=1 Tax=Papaver somniferum TaxID=3469 RepID=UPI000E6FA47C|nr:subtilisin-like protease SBT5.3 [Papaver somniferum]
MEKYITIILLTLFFFCRHAVANEAVSTTKHYIVYMGEHSYSDSNSVTSSNHDLLASIIGSIREAEEATVYHYHKSFRGFSAKLMPEQAQKLRETESVISVFESKAYELHTTHSWEFLLHDFPQDNKSIEIESKSDVIVGVFDTGIWPESESFNDKGLGPIPERFKGKCVAGDLNNNFTCNRKIIGAQFYKDGYEAQRGLLDPRTVYLSPRDSNGHGTHTASTIAGSVVNNVSLFGMASGTARGGMPNARLAIYKVCWPGPGGCTDADILSAYDDAIHDGVDIISESLGYTPEVGIENLFTDVNSIGSFHAFQKGILVSASAGNTGTLSTVANGAPWIFTVAASTINREFNSYVHLGNSTILKGSSINPLKMDKHYGIVFATDVPAFGVQAETAGYCYPNTLDHKLIKGKIVVCSSSMNDPRTLKSQVVEDGGGVGMILIDPFYGNDIGFEHGIPTARLEAKEIEILQKHLKINKNATAIIYPTTTEVSNIIAAPKMAFFSSMGPNIIAPDVIKPDITAPGVNILAAWSPAAPTQFGSVNYRFDSGTSMSCPHATGVAAIIKSHRPTWSPAAIKSAIMTTATRTMRNNMELISKNPSGSPATPFDYGSGHINPAAALDPGLIYDYNTSDIIDFLCSTSGASKISNLATCKKPPIPTYDLNYPSIGVANFSGNISVSRTVTYNGDGPAEFTATWDTIPGVNVIVEPSELKFKEEGEKLSFKVHFVPEKISYEGLVLFGSITWSYENKYKVTSPIALNMASAIA